MTPETKLKIAERALEIYIEESKKKNVSLVYADIFSQSVQQSLIEVCEETGKTCPIIKCICMKLECAWWNITKDRCGMVSRQKEIEKRTGAS